MALSLGSKITQADIKTLIDALNAENTRRGSPYTAITVPSQGVKMTAALGAAIEAMPRNLNTIHKITRTSKAAGTAGGTPSGFDNTDRSASYGAGQKVLATPIGIVNTNITKLAAQCNCDTFVATNCCNAQTSCAADYCNQSGCKCNGNANGNGCGNCCNGQCCNVECVNNSYNCCNSNKCINGANCYNCCNSQCCNGVCSCNNVCTCNLNCSCEFN